VRRIWVEAGSRVKSGDPLVALAAPEYQARVSQAQAGTAQARAHLAQAEADYRRYQRLLKEEAVSPREFETMEARYRAARAAVAQSQAQVQEAAAFKDYTVVRAPRTGVVAERRVAPGDLAQPGQTLVSLYDPRDLQIEGEVNDDYRPQMRLGLPVQVTVPAISWEAESALSEIFPISAPGSRTFKVRTRPMAHEGLAPGMFARLRLPLGETRGILIPRAAVRQVGQLPMVEVVQDQTSELRLVKLGREVADQVEVLAGLAPGDRLLAP
jgi:RND family efflux transporter MFP subunit